MFKTITALTLTLILFVGMVIPTSAVVPETVLPRWSYVLNFYINEFVIDPDTGIAECGAGLDTRQYLPGKIVCELQRYVGGLWATIKSWEATGSMGADVYGCYAVYSGYRYRVKATGYVYSSSGALLETVTATTPEQYYSGN